MHKRVIGLTFLFFLVLLGMLGESSSQGRRFVVNKLAVRQVEMGFRLGEPSLRVRLHLESGEAVEQELAEGTDVDYFLSLTRIMGSGKGRMFAELSDGDLVSVQLAVP